MDPAPSKLASQFCELAERFRELARRTGTPRHLARHLFDRDVQAGRLLIQAIGADMFPRAQAQRNRGWWDLTTGRWPGAALVSLADVPDGRHGLEAVSPTQLALSWTMAVGSWLVRGFPERFADGAEGWDWARLARDRQGRFLGKDGKPLRYWWYKDGQPLADEFKVSPGMKGKYECRLESDVAYESDSYDDHDWLEHHRARVDVHADACILLAELVGSAAPASQLKPTRRRRRPATRPIERPLTAIETRTLEVVGRHRQNFAAAAEELNRNPKTVRENYNRAMEKMSRMTGPKGRSVSTTSLPTDRRGQIDVDDHGG